MRGTLLTLIILALALPATAGAQSSGNSGIDQYQENIPAATGNRPTDKQPSGKQASQTNPSKTGTQSGAGTGTAGAVTNASRSSPGTANALDKLAKLGPDAKRTAEAAAATAPRLTGSGGSNSSGDSGYGMGWALPVILGLSLVAAVAVAVLRWRRGTPPGAA